MNKLILLTSIMVLTGLFVPQSVQAASGPELFKFYCAQCHGLKGKGDGPNVTQDFKTDPRDFTKAKEMVKLSDADIRNVVLDGGPSVSKSELMPPWSKTLSNGDVDKLVKHLRKLCKCKGK